MNQSVRPCSSKQDLSVEGGKPGSLDEAQIVLLLYGGKLSAWKITLGLVPAELKIKGQAQLDVRDEQSLVSAYEDLVDRLRGDGVDMLHPLWIVDIKGRQWRTAGATTKSNSWQLPWEWLAQRFGLGDMSPWEKPKVLREHILPWLISADDDAQRRYLQHAREREHASEADRLAAERTELEQENERLRNQNAALRRVDVELLVSFLPALYPRVFTVIGPVDLALLCGRLDPVALPNPYPEPAEESLRILQKRFRVLPDDVQQQIVGFISSLPQSQKLRPRPEMRDLVEALAGLSI